MYLPHRLVFNLRKIKNISMDVYLTEVKNVTDMMAKVNVIVKRHCGLVHHQKFVEGI